MLNRAPFSTWADSIRHMLQQKQTRKCDKPILLAEGRKSDIVVMGEKGRAQLVRLERDRILSTVNDVNKMRITFSQASCNSYQPANISMSCAAGLLYFILMGQCDFIVQACKLLMLVATSECCSLSYALLTISDCSLLFKVAYNNACLQICSIAEELLKTEYDALRIVYNKFGSAVSYKPTIATILSPDVRQVLSSQQIQMHTYNAACHADT